jgi:hypothetical protein
VLTATTNHFTKFGEQASPTVAEPGRIMVPQVDLHSGAAMYNYPFELPPGPGGFQPKLELQYNSGSVDEMKSRSSVGSWVGIGWNFSVGKITYDLSTGQYYLDLNGGSQQIVSANVTDYRVNPDDYSKITRNGNTWELLDRDGNYYRFGGTDNSTQ